MSDIDHLMTIGDDAVAGASSFEVRNPATGAVVGLAPSCSRDQLDTAMAAADAAADGWRHDRALRTTSLLAAADAVEVAVTDIANLLTAEQGKPLVDARREVIGGCAWLRYFAQFDDPPDVLQDDQHALVRVVRKPVGVTAGIIPWNFPVIMAMQTIAPALAAGNTIVVKPSPYTPLATLATGRILAQHLPTGVINVVAGPDPLGAWMTSHPLVRKIHFTGSVETGKQVAAAAAPDLKRFTLELGGNDPAILLDDVDVDAAADRLFWGAFTNNGQVCIAIKRVYAPQSKYDAIVSALADRASSVRVGEGTAPDTQLGPINNRPQFERVSELVSDALRRGGVAAAGGAPIEGPGHFFQPTVLKDVSDGMRIVDEEQFGPALPVIAYRDLDEAVARANGTHYGLGASVWSTDPERAEATALRLESGAAWINTHMGARPDLPIGGVKWSGVGVAWGRDGFRSFTEAQLVHRPRV